jgi:hypothetical protein
MTHSLHRVGDTCNLREDFVFLCTPSKGINNNGAAQKLIRILDIIMEIGPVNIGFYGHGNIMGGINIEDIKKSIHDNSRLRCCFDDKEKLIELLRRIKQDDFGLSITISGLIDDIMDISRRLSINPHTINLSCGVYGKVERLPDKSMLELSTMCGHGMIGHRLTKNLTGKIIDKEIEIHNAVEIMGRLCTCGIFNPVRARKILERNIDVEKS